MTACQQLGIAGVVIDGAVRDSLEIDEMDYPGVLGRHQPERPDQEHRPAASATRCRCGGVTVHPGDFVIGDGDGVMVVEREKIESLLPLAAKKVQGRGRAHRGDQGAATPPPRGSTRALRTAGVLKEGETL